MKDSTSYIILSIILIISGAIMRDIIHVSESTQRSVGLFVSIVGIVLLTKAVAQIVRSKKTNV